MSPRSKLRRVKPNSGVCTQTHTQSCRHMHRCRCRCTPGIWQVCAAAPVHGGAGHPVCSPETHPWPQGCQTQLCPGALEVCCHLPTVIHFDVGVVLGMSEKQQMKKKHMISCSALLHKAANLHLSFEKKRLDDQHSAGTVS